MLQIVQKSVSTLCILSLYCACQKI